MFPKAVKFVVICSFCLWKENKVLSDFNNSSGRKTFYVTYNNGTQIYKIQQVPHSVSPISYRLQHRKDSRLVEN